MGLNAAQPRNVMDGDDDWKRCDERNGSARTVQQLRTALQRTQRQEHLIPDYAPVETPWIVLRKTQRHGVDIRSRQGLEQAARICADASCRADGLLRIDCDV